jgi:hypothetical protein
MPFPINLESLLAAGYVFLRSETCPACREPVEVFTTPGKREIALNPMCELLRPAVRHYETCKPSIPTPEAQKPQEQAAVPRQIAMYAVTDPNHQLLSAGWSDGTLVCQFAKGKGQYAGVPEDEYLKLRRARFAYRQLHTNIKGKYPYTKLE